MASLKDNRPLLQIVKDIQDKKEGKIKEKPPTLKLTNEFGDKTDCLIGAVKIEYVFK